MSFLDSIETSLSPFLLLLPPRWLRPLYTIDSASKSNVSALIFAFIQSVTARPLFHEHR